MLKKLPDEIQKLVGETIRGFSQDCNSDPHYLDTVKSDRNSRLRDSTLLCLVLTCKSLKRVYRPILLREVTLSFDQIGGFLYLLSSNPTLAQHVESLKFVNLSASRSFQSRSNENIRQVANRVWERAGRSCLDARSDLLKLDSDDESQNDEDENYDDFDVVEGHTEEERKKKRMERQIIQAKTSRSSSSSTSERMDFKTSLLYIYYAKGAIIESLPNLRSLQDETYIDFPLIRRMLFWDAPLRGLQSLKTLILQNTCYDFKGVEIPSTRAKTLTWYLLFLPNLKQAKLKIGIDPEDAVFLEFNLEQLSRRSSIEELMLDCLFLENAETAKKDNLNFRWNNRSMESTFTHLISSTRNLISLDLTVTQLSVPLCLSCLKSLHSSFGTLKKLKIKADSRFDWAGPPEFSGVPTLTSFANLEQVILDADFILSLQVPKDGIPMPNRRADVDVIMRLPETIDLHPIKLYKLKEIVVLSSSIPNSNPTSNPASKKVDTILSHFIKEHYLVPNLQVIKVHSPDALRSSRSDLSASVPSLDRRSSITKAKKGRSSLDQLYELCERKNIRLELSPPGQEHCLLFSKLGGLE